MDGLAYNDLLRTVLSTGYWLLTTAHDAPEWEQQFAEYQDDLRRLKQATEALRPACLREEPAEEAWPDPFPDSPLAPTSPHLTPGAIGRRAAEHVAADCMDEAI